MGGQHQNSSGGTGQAIDWVRQNRMDNINHVLLLLAPSVRVVQGGLMGQMVQRVGEVLRAIVGQLEDLRKSSAAGETGDARLRGWCCEKLVALLASVRVFCLVTGNPSSTIDGSLVVRGLVEMLTIAGENADPVLLAQSEALVHASASFDWLQLAQSEALVHASTSTYLLVSAAEALAKEGGDAADMDFRLSGLQKLVGMRSLADCCAEAMRAGSLDNVLAVMERTRRQQKSYTGLAEKIWSLLRRLGGR